MHSRMTLEEREEYLFLPNDMPLKPCLKLGEYRLSFNEVRGPLASEFLEDRVQPIVVLSHEIQDATSHSRQLRKRALIYAPSNQQ